MWWCAMQAVPKQPRKQRRIAGPWESRALAIQADVAEEAAVQSLFAQTLEAFGRVDVLVNSAGITRTA